MRLIATLLLAGGVTFAAVPRVEAQGPVVAPTATRVPLVTASPLGPGLPGLLQTPGLPGGLPPLPPGALQTPQAPPLPRSTQTTPGLRPNVQATATAASATITTADATSTAVIGAPLTAVALTATALAVPTRTPTALSSPTSAATPTRTATAVATAVPTIAATPTMVQVAATATPDPLAVARTVVITAPIAVGEQTIGVGTALEIPLLVPLEDNAIPAGTVIRLPDGQTVRLPSGVNVPAAESPSVLQAPLNAVLSAITQFADGLAPAGTAVVLPAGTSVLGGVEPNSAALVRAGGSVQIDGRTRTLADAAQVVISPAPVARPATLPATGDADPVLWPAALGVILLLVGWRLRRTGPAREP